MSKKLEGKIALITGGSTGIGLATARRFVAEGAYVFITGRRQAELDEAIARIGSNVSGMQGDAGSLSDLDTLYDQIRREKGHLDIIFANAGGGAFAPLGSITEGQYASTFDSNVKGLIFTVQKALPLLLDGSSIILNASTTTVKGLPAFSVYSASKAAVRSFARTWTTDLKERRIRVNAISPGATETPGWLALARNEEEKKAMFAQVAAEVPLGRIAQPDEIAKAVVFLASDDASFISGVELFVDGGAAQV
jgi:NAD(P)-dependent dehydrogenase (short-subunit alcohol dehydrogenase family)